MVTSIAWLGNPEARILSIRHFRKYLETLDISAAILVAKKCWKTGPKISKLRFDLNETDTWPSPWDLFSQNSFCENSQILGAYYTLLLSEHVNEYDINLKIVNDIIRGTTADIIYTKKEEVLTNTVDFNIINGRSLQCKLGDR